MRKEIAKLLRLSACGLLLLLFFIPSHLYAQSCNGWKDWGYEGRVESVRAYVVEFDEDGKRGKRRIDSIKRFDRRGCLIEETVFSDDGSILLSDANTYDVQGRLISTSTKHSPFTYLPDVTIYKYDESGKLIERNGYNNKDELVNKSVYKYDNGNRRIEWLSNSFHREENSKPHRWTYSHYESGQIKQEMFYSDKGAGFQPEDHIPGGAYRKIYFYDEHGKRISTLRYKSNGEFGGMDITKYDSRGNEIEEIEFDANGNLKEKKAYKYRYDRVGNYVEETTFSLASDGEARRLRIEEISYYVIKYYPEGKSGK